MTGRFADKDPSADREVKPTSSVNQQLDSLLLRIQAMTAGEPSADRQRQTPRQTPRPAVESDPLAIPPAPASPAIPASPAARAIASEVPPHLHAQEGQSPGHPASLSTSRAPLQSATRRQVPAPIGFIPGRDEPWRPTEPLSFDQAHINETILEAIIFRCLLNTGELQGRRIAEQVKLPFRLVEPLLGRLKLEQHVAYKSSTATNDYVYVLTESGRAIARNHNSDSTYYGACPVRLNDYIESVRQQTIEGQYPKRADLQHAFHDLLISPKMLEKLGPAVASGRGMFLFGYPGNGKTSIAERVTGAFGKYIWIPRAIDIDGEIMRVYDPMNHRLAMPEANSGILEVADYDKRWVRIERPTIVVGGELTMDMLEVRQNTTTGISESPIQMKSNCGTLVIDDFGRQKMSVDQLLNRWIIPLEKRYDYLNMISGKKIQVPFDQLVIFSTNLEPKDLVDDAFLRRIPYKIEVPNPPEADFRKLFEIMCRVLKIPYNAAAVDYVIKTHYIPVNRPFRNCQPRDLLLQVRNYCTYNDLEVELREEYFDFACENYFSVM